MSLKSTANGDGLGAGAATGSAVSVDGASAGSDNGTGVTSDVEDPGAGVVVVVSVEGVVGVVCVEDEPPPDPPLPEPPVLAGGTASAVSAGFGFFGAGFSTAGFSTAGAEAASAIAIRFAGFTVLVVAGGGAATGITSSSGTIGLRTTSLVCAGGGAVSLSLELVVVSVVPHAASKTVVKSNATNRKDMVPLACKENLVPPRSLSTFDAAPCATDPRM
jgi:hypothetical protein